MKIFQKPAPLNKLEETDYIPKSKTTLKSKKLESEKKDNDLVRGSFIKFCYTINIDVYPYLVYTSIEKCITNKSAVQSIMILSLLTQHICLLSHLFSALASLTSEIPVQYHKTDQTTFSL